jgi:hypothetical protein
VRIGGTGASGCGFGRRRAAPIIFSDAMPHAARSAVRVVRRLLDQLHEEMSEWPDEIYAPISLPDVRFHLERIAGPGGSLRAAVNALEDDSLEILLEADADWHDIDGAWGVRAPVAHPSGAAGAAHLDGMRKQAAAPVTSERTLSHLVQLLRDPAYGLVTLERKLYQLNKIVIAELVREQRAMADARGAPPQTCIRRVLDGVLDVFDS